MSAFLSLLCGLVAVCTLIPIVGVLSAFDTLITENRQLRKENERLRGTSRGSS